MSMERMGVQERTLREPGLRTGSRLPKVVAEPTSPWRRRCYQRLSGNYKVRSRTQRMAATKKPESTTPIDVH